MSRDDQIQALLDRQAIAELSYRYSRAADRLDRELLESVYWPDGTDDHGAFVGSAPDYASMKIRMLLCTKCSLFTAAMPMFAHIDI